MSISCLLSHLPILKQEQRIKYLKKRNDESIKIVPIQEHININIDWNINSSTVNFNSNRVNKAKWLVIIIQITY